ncbi:MAG: 5-methyltetrahydropteroyltriglutamate--homocysteine S-methyltransferase [Rhodospirillaceae bacterium]|jgi:5-methyltetrahydropteroyltriglutamate--homocysteine methyltransferase|nr:5-methyltetrahydropteroyltriglutamate--homocysteine S-methyltransferase [Rhodospirillaceae bacterium]MBT5454965.1 5-methyltetrahydropteroyltriglutamate--homocysteine S-methyltransferase [Rhodospirillaceae bacterium]
MTDSGKPPFRADHVGSLLRPQSLIDARRRLLGYDNDKAAPPLMGGHENAELRALEDECIRDAVTLQEDLGLKGVTDGEYRRTFFHLDFLEQFDGVEVTTGIPAKFQGGSKKVEFAPPKMVVSGKLERPQGIATDDFAYLKSLTRNTAKLCIPSPTMLHFRGGRKAVDEGAYPDMADFFTDLARVYAEEIAALGELGCTYLQLDDTNLAYLCDPAIQESTRQLGEDPATLPRQYAKLINEAISSRPKDMAITIHLCRGNFKSAWVAEGGYEPVAEVLFNELDVDGYFLEYDDERSGDFAPLRFVPKGKRVVLGLVSSKLAALESKDEIKARIDEAAKYMPLDQMALSPQCGFSSTVHGNDLSVEEEKAKIRLIVETADDVWGTA